MKVDKSVQITPVPEPEKEEEKTHQSPDMGKWKSAQVAMVTSISPASRDAARLNSEIIKEVRDAV